MTRLDDGGKEEIAMFRDRTHHREILISSADANEGSRVGGRAPESVVAASPQCPRCGGPMAYLLTLAANVLGEAIAGGNMASLLYCRKFSCRNRSQRLTEGSALVLLVTEASPRSAAASELDAELVGRALTLGPLREDARGEDGEVETEHSKLGGRPGYIQRGWSDATEQLAHAKGQEFLFQWADRYPEDMEVEELPFAGGIVYVFCTTDAGSMLPPISALSAFWQNT